MNTTPTAARIDTEPPPHDADAEHSLIGSILLGSDLAGLEAVRRIVGPSDMYQTAAKHALRAVYAMHDVGEGIDVTLLAAALEDLPPDTRDRTRDFIHEAVEEASSPVLALDYARRVRAMADRRALLTAALTLEHGARNGKATCDVLRDAEADLQQIRIDAESLDAGGGPALEVYDVGALAGLEDARYDHAIEGVATFGMLTLLHGAAKCGKGQAAHSMAGALARGLPTWAGLPALGEPVPVLYLSEDSPGALREQGEILDLPRERLHFAPFTMGNARLQTLSSVVDAVRAQADRLGARVIFWDSLAHWGRLSEGQEQDASVMGAALRSIRTLALGGRAVVVIHHSRKHDGGDPVQGARGSGGIGAEVDVAICLSMPAAGSDFVRRLHGRGRLQAHNVNVLVEYDPTTRTYHAARNPQHERNEELDVAILAAMDRLAAQHPGTERFGRNRIHGIVKGNVNALDRRLAWLSRDGGPLDHHPTQGYRRAGDDRTAKDDHHPVLGTGGGGHTSPCTSMTGNHDYDQGMTTMDGHTSDGRTS